MKELPRVAAQKCSGQESNLRPVDHKSGIVETTSSTTSSHMLLGKVNNNIENVCVSTHWQMQLYQKY